MLFQLLFSSPGTFVTIAIALIAALTVHEAAHAYVANKLGDDTAVRMGRLTLNPLAHLDPIGVFMLLLLGFGWGKPVSINPNNLKSPLRDEIFIAFAGPISNFLLACALAAIYYFIKPFASQALQELFLLTGYYNILLMFFNFLPIPPLDGSKILRLFLPRNIASMLDQYGLFILLIVIFIPIGGGSILDHIILVPAGQLFSLLFRHSPFI